MRTLAAIVFHLALGLWVGALVFVSFIVAPAVFAAVPGDTAGTVMGAIFPRYYLFTAAMGVLALAAGWGARPPARHLPWNTLLVMVGVMLAATVYAGAVVSPKARALRPALHQEPVDPAVRREFDALHQRAVQLNGLVLVLGFAAMTVSTVTARRTADDRRL